MAGLRLVSVNIERSRHLERVIPFIQSVRPDVLCVQELEEPDVAQLQDVTGYDALYVPFGIVPSSERHPRDGVASGVGIFALDIEDGAADFYRGSADDVRSVKDHFYRNLAVVRADIMHEGERYTVATTHFTWSPNGSVTDEQRRDHEAMQRVLDELDEFVLCGDFNAPRGTEIFSKLASRYTDNIPQEYTTSLDGNLHRAGPLPYMVDGLFSTGVYEVSNVRLEDGVSDHMAIVARVSIR